MKWYLEVLQKYAVFSGRARRKEFWLFILFDFLIAIALAGIDDATGLTKSGYSPLSSLYGLAVLVPSVAVAVRRLHDTGHSGWWWLMALVPRLYGLAVLVPGVAVAARRLHDTHPSEWLALVLGPLVGDVVLFIFMVLDSAPGQNQYGPNPKQAVARPAMV